MKIGEGRKRIKRMKLEEDMENVWEKRIEKKKRKTEANYYDFMTCHTS